MCSLFIALIPPHSSLLLFSSLLLSLSFGLRCTDSNRLQWRSVCLWETEAQTKRRYRNMASRHFSRRVIQYEWNTSSSACVCLRSVFVRRDDGGVMRYHNCCYSRVNHIHRFWSEHTFRLQIVLLCLTNNQTGHNRYSVSDNKQWGEFNRYWTVEIVIYLSTTTEWHKYLQISK